MQESGSEAWTDAPSIPSVPASDVQGPQPIVPRTSRYITLDTIKLRQRLKRRYGESSAISVGTNEHFATSFGGLAHTVTESVESR